MSAELRRISRRAGAALALTVAVFWRAALTRDIFIGRDIVRVYYPLRHYFAQRVLGGSFPTWYPYDGLGQPYVGMMMGSVFHPASLLYLVLPLFLALKWNILLSYALGWLGLYVLLRGRGLSRAPGALGATLFAFTGYAVCISNNLLYLMAAAALPWVFHFALRHFERPSTSRLLLASAALASLVLAGDPQSFALAAGGVLLLSLGGKDQRRVRVLQAFSVVSVAALLAAAQLLPSWAARGEAWVAVNPLETALRWSGHPLRLVELLLGPLWLLPGRDALLSPQVGRIFEPILQSEWVDSQHVGLLAVALATAGAGASFPRPLGKLLCGAFIAVLLLWLGRYAGLYGLLHDRAPLWGSFRYPEKLTPFLVLLLAVGAAHGLEQMSQALAPSRRLAGVLAGLGGAVALLAGLEWRGGLFSRRLLPAAGAVLLPPADVAQLGQNFIRCAAETAVGLGLAALCLACLRTPAARRWSVALLCAAAGVLPNVKLASLAPPDLLTETPELLRQMKAGELAAAALSPLRVAVWGTDGPLPAAAAARLREAFHAGLGKPEFDAQSGVASLLPDVAALWGVEAAEGYLPAASLRNRGSTLQETTGLFDTAYLVTHAQQFESLHSPPASAVARSALGLVVRRNPGRLSRAYLAAPHCVADAAAAFAFVAGPDFHPGLDAAVECASALPPSAGPGAAGTARVSAYLPEEVTVEVEAQRPAVLVLNDAYYSGWTSTVDGAPSRIFAVNGMVRGVAVGAGTHDVVFRYRTPGLLSGVALSLGTLGVLLAAMLGERLRRYGRSS